MRDKKGYVSSFGTRQDWSLELGCGSRKRTPGAIGIDVRDSEDVDIVGDVMEVFREIPSGCIRLITSFHFVEHVEDLPGLVAECARVLASGGEFRAVAPHFSNPYFASDPTHRRTFGLYSFSYLAVDRIHRRRVPHYWGEPEMELTAVRLRFKTASEFPIRWALKRGLGALLTATRGLRELYEDSLCFIFPCYEVEYVLKRRPRAGE